MNMLSQAKKSADVNKTLVNNDDDDDDDNGGDGDDDDDKCNKLDESFEKRLFFRWD